MQRRSNTRIDYRKFNSTGQKQSIQEEVQSGSTPQPLDKMAEAKIEIAVIIDEVQDVIDENPIYGSIPRELDTAISKLQTFRTDLRRRTHSMQLDENLGSTVNETLARIKDYIKSSKDYSSKMNLANTKEEENSVIIKKRSAAFVLENMCQNLDEIENCIFEDLSAVNDKTLIQIKADSSKLPERLEKISEKYEQLLQQPITDGDVLHHIQTIGAKYVKLNTAKMKFIENINKEFLSRESWTRIRATSTSTSN